MEPTKSGNTQSSRGLNTRELATVESWLQRDGYRLVAKTAEKDLLPGEYIKRSSPSFVYSVSGRSVWEVVWSARKTQ